MNFAKKGLKNIKNAFQIKKFVLQIKLFFIFLDMKNKKMYVYSKNKYLIKLNVSYLQKKNVKHGFKNRLNEEVLLKS